MWRLVWTVAVAAAWHWPTAGAGAAVEAAGLVAGGGEAELLRLVDSVASKRVIPVISGVTIRRLDNVTGVGEGRGGGSVGAGGDVVDRLDAFTRTHVLDIKVPEVVRSARLLTQNMPRFAFGKNSFLTGFGLGFLAFGLKKLLLPVFIGAQIVKSVLLAMFLPSIIGGIAKLMGKGLTSVAQGSSSSAHTPGQDTITDFDFKDTGGGGGGGYDSLGAGSDDNPGVWTYPPDNSARQPFPAYTSSGLGASSMALKQQSQDRFQAQSVKYSYQDPAKHQGSFYSRDKQQDFKVFHGIPASSQLLANYDPFYSPLLSRLDAVFQQLGHRDEACRERLVCHMYGNPAKFAPFSNLVSAQLSRELNELRKPSTDNPEILRFFRYMKAAKDGQDGAECDRAYPGCAAPLDTPARAPMLTTYNEIDKLVHARRLS